MKKLFYLAFIALIISSCGDDSSGGGSPKPQGFAFNLVSNGRTLTAGESHTMRIEIPSNDVQKVELFLDGRSIWSKSEQLSDKMEYVLETTTMPLGSHRIELEVTKKDGKTRKKAVEKVLLATNPPKKRSASVVNSYKHDNQAFTQGLEFYKGVLFEGTGNRGQSTLRKVDLESGSVDYKINLEGQYFGEGITILNDKVYQITYTSKKGFVYETDSFKLIKEFNFSTTTSEGWGLTHDNEFLIISDGSHRLYFVDTVNFSTVKTLEVYSNTGPVNYLNELEYIDGKIYANQWQSYNVVIIDPQTGTALEQVDMYPLVDELGETPPEVLNGLAYNHDTRKLYATGKYWPKLFEIEIK